MSIESMDCLGSLLSTHWRKPFSIERAPLHRIAARYALRRLSHGAPPMAMARVAGCWPVS